MKTLRQRLGLAGLTLLAGGFTALFLGTVPASAADADGSSTEQPYQVIGTIDAVDLKEGYVIIDDHQYNFSSNLQVHAGNRSSSRYSLRKGAQVGLNMEVMPNGQKMATEIWMLQ